MKKRTQPAMAIQGASGGAGPGSYMGTYVSAGQASAKLVTASGTIKISSRAESATVERTGDMVIRMSVIS
jgi:hypothetical protein